MKEDRIYLLHIRDAIEKVLKYSAVTKDVFLSDSKTQEAVVRNIEIMGEATKNLSQSLTAKYPGIPWKRIAGMRDKVIHEYFGVNYELIWGVIQKDFPGLREAIHEILRNNEQGF